MSNRPELLLQALTQVWATGEWEVAALERVQQVLTTQPASPARSEQALALEHAILRRRDRTRQKMQELIDAYRPAQEELAHAQTTH